MRTGIDILKRTQADFLAIRRDVAALGREVPVIVIYDMRRGDLVIRPKDENRQERSARVGKLIRQYFEKSG